MAEDGMRRLAAFLVSTTLSLATVGVTGEIRVPIDYPSIQEAIVAASDGDTILVAAGTYSENIDFLGKAIWVTSVDGPELTILNGNQSGSVVTFRSGEGLGSVLEGFTLTNGSGTLRASVTLGGGIFCEDASPTIRGNTISDNSCDLGGGIYCWLYSSPTVEGNVIERNEAIRAGGGGMGGGVLIEESASPLLVYNVMVENVAGFQGGGIACNFSASPVIGANKISRNTAEFGGGGIAVLGESSAEIRDNLIAKNRGGFEHACIGSGVYSLNSEVTVCGNTIERNEGSEGTGLYVEESKFSIFNNLVRFNTGEAFYGGGFLFRGSEGTLSNNLISGNSAIHGGGVACYEDSGTRIINNTIALNYGVGSDLYLFSSSPTVTNSILWSEGVTIRKVGTSNPIISHCIVRGGWPDGDGNIDSDPEFVDRSNLDFHIRIDSPCVDAGDNGAPDIGATDWEGDPRVLNGNRDPEAIVDIGADEMVPEIGARFGMVNVAGGSLSNVLVANGSAGDRRRVVELAPDAALSVEMVPSAAGPDPARFVLYAWHGEPVLETLTPHPYGLGVMGHGTPLKGDAGDQPVAIWNNMGFESRLGVATFSSLPAPCVVINRPQGVGASLTVTLQGFIEDAGSIAQQPGGKGPASITNAVVLKVE
jgi:hypothetical protein